MLPPSRCLSTRKQTRSPRQAGGDWTRRGSLQPARAGGRVLDEVLHDVDVGSVHLDPRREMRSALPMRMQEQLGANAQRAGDRGTTRPAWGHGVDKHRLGGSIRVLDQWTSLDVDAYDLVCAFDVLEHVEDLAATLKCLLAATRTSGMLAESSPFVRNAWNPMHHESAAQFDRIMEKSGFVLAHTGEHFRYLWNDGGARGHVTPPKDCQSAEWR